MRGFIYLKDASDVVSEVSRYFISTLDTLVKDTHGLSMEVMAKNYPIR